MKLFAISDLHISFAVNRDALSSMARHPDDWLAIVGDACETNEQLEYVLRIACERYRQVLWVPGNHELWSTEGLHGQAKYEALVAICRRFNVLTPEDPYPVWEGEGGPKIIAPLFLLYDYSFRPSHVVQHQAKEWAAESGIICADEELLRPDPFRTVSDWCNERCRLGEIRLAAVAGSHPLVLLNHFPMRQDTVHIPLVPRFSIWCGTTKTEDWHRRFNAAVVVSGHLHVPTTTWRDGVRFEEVSLGYPRQWQRQKGCDHYVREILPGPPPPHPERAELVWRG